MDHKIFAIYDQKAFAYLPPFTLPRVEMAERTFADCCNAPDHMFGKHPSDYTLFELGTYDDSKGTIAPHSTPLVIGTGIEYIKAIDPQPKELLHGTLQPIGDVAPILSDSKRGTSAI